MVIFDATFLMLLVDPSAAVPLADDGLPIPFGRERVEHLLSELSTWGRRIGIPTPALSEVLVGAKGSISDLVVELTSSYKLKSLPFDELAAIEVALMSDKQNLEGGLNDETKAKVKYDRQIIAIAKVVQADAIYSDDIGLCKKAAKEGIATVGLKDCPLPPKDVQGMLELSAPESASEAQSFEEEESESVDISADLNDEKT